MSKLDTWDRVANSWSTCRMLADYVSLLSSIDTTVKRIPAVVACAWEDDAPMAGVFTRGFFERIDQLFKAVYLTITTDCDAVNLYWVSSLIKLFGGDNNTYLLDNDEWKTSISKGLAEIYNCRGSKDRAVRLFIYLKYDAGLIEHCDEIAVLCATLSLLQDGIGIMIVPYAYIPEFKNLCWDCHASDNYDRLSEFIKKNCILG